MAGVKRGKTTASKCASCGGAIRAAHRFCPSCGSPIGVPAPQAPGGPSLQIATARPEALEEQRKVVTTLFADLSGSTQLGERLDPEELREILARYFSTLARHIQRFGGTVDKYVGDAVMAVFGAPVSHEDDAERAIRAALGMREAIGRENDELERKHGVRLHLEIGINSGEAVAGLLAGDVQSAYTVVGDVMNTAQRLESAAPPNEIYVGESTYRLARHAFEFEAVPSLSLKGKREPVPAYRVVRRVSEILLRDTPPFVGREVELQRLRGLLEAARGGRGQALHVHGEAGVGKSRLLYEFCSALPGGTMLLRARCLSYESTTPYALVADLIRRAFDIIPADEERAAREKTVRGFGVFEIAPDESAVALFLEVLGYESRSRLDPERKRQLLVSLLRLFLRRQADMAPFVVLAEDVHWIDPASRSAFTEMLAELPQLPCLFITTSREETLFEWPAERLAIDPLDEGAAAEMVDRLVVGLEASVRGLLLERTGGNPLFIQEVARGLATGATTTVPTTVQEMLEARLDALEPSPKRVAQRAAVIGRFFWTRLLARVAPQDRLDVALPRLEAERFVQLRSRAPEESYAFRHALIQEVVYQTQLISQRRTLHTTVGRALEELYPDRIEEIVDMLAFHYGRGEDDSKARTYLIRAGERARLLYAREEALTYYREALARSADEPVSAAAALEGLGDIERLAGHYADALAHYAEAHALAVADVTRSRLLRKTGAVHQLRGAPAPALESLSRALAVLPEPEDRERAQVLIEIGQVRWQQGNYEQAIETLEQAIQHAERGGADEARANAYRHLGTTYVLKGDAATGLRHYERSLALFEALGDVFGQANQLNNIGIVYRKEGRYSEALESHRRALAIRERIGDPWGLGLARNNIAQILRARGDLGQAETEYRAALDVWSSIGYVLGVAIARTGLGIAQVERGDRLEGRANLVGSLDDYAAAGSKTYLSETQRYVAQSYIGDDPEAALEWAERAVATAAAPDQHGVALQVLGRIRESRGERDAAIAALEHSRERLTGTAERQELARTLAVLGRLYGALPAQDARRAEAPGLTREARLILTELGAHRDLDELREAVPAS